MRTGVGLGFICVGAILAFAVTTNTSVFNLHTAGWVIMLVGLVGLVVPRRTYGWLGRRLVRRTRTYPAGSVEEVGPPIRAGLPPRSPLMSDDPVGTQSGDPGYRPPRDGDTEVIEDIYEV
jgi:hypothetical protein